MRAGDAPMKAQSVPRVRARWLLVALALVSATAQADYRENYAKALKAYQSGSLQEAQALFAQAAAEHPEPQERIKLYGLRFEPYLPQHYLGLIAAQLGDCGRARVQWGAAGNADVVAKVGDAAADEKSAAAKCGGAIAQSKPMVPDATPTNPTSPQVVSTPTKPATPSPPPNKPAVLPPTVVAVNKPSEPAVSKPAPQEAPAEKPAPEKSAPPDQLVLTFESFLGGRLTEVSRINPDAYADARARFHAYLVRSGARYTLSQLNGDQGLLDAARADARAAKQLNASASPDAVLFSPRFVDRKSVV